MQNTLSLLLEVFLAFWDTAFVCILDLSTEKEEENRERGRPLKMEALRRERRERDSFVHCRYASTFSSLPFAWRDQFIMLCR